MRRPLKRFDDFLIKKINQDLRHPLLNIFFYYYTHLGGTVFTAVFALGLLIFARGDVALVAWQMALALALNMSLAFVIKRIFGRNRPYWIEKNLNTYGIDLKDYSFPSGHTTSAFTMAMIFSLNYPAIWPIFILMALLVAISRIYLAVHYPTDVLAGIVLAVLGSLVVHRIIFPRLVNLFLI